MRWKLPFILSLTLLQGAAEQQEPCSQDAAPGQTPIAPLTIDLGRAGLAFGMATQTARLAPQAPTAKGCLQTGAQGTLESSLRNERADIVHRLPLPDILHSPLEPPNTPR